MGKNKKECFAKPKIRDKRFEAFLVCKRSVDAKFIFGAPL